MNPKPEKTSLLQFIKIILALIAAFYLGTQLGDNFGLINRVDFSTKFKKLSEVYHLVKLSYVDEPEIDKMQDGSIEGMLRNLDPHSVYIPPKEQERIAERFAGNFSGIGIQFEIRDETIIVVSPIPGTPADRMGLQAGDHIIKIDSISTYGITYEEVFNKLRGEDGSKVNITVQRVMNEEPFELSLTRSQIPIHSVDAAFLLADKKTGYILINQFTSVTANELDEALFMLEHEGMERLILDLRGNSGGYLQQADIVADRFLEAGKIIVTTEGRIRSSKEKRISTDYLSRTDLPLVILVNRGSASASEIVAGAIQDHDRGLIIGESTFGKGLVQTPFELKDGSVVRITTARWFTPSGRCVQKSYEEGFSAYVSEIISGTDSLDAIKDTTNLKKYYTNKGRVVYANQGIEPDLVVTSGKLSKYGSSLLRERILIDWSRDFAETLTDFDETFESFRDNWKPNKEQLSELFNLASEKNISFNPEEWEKDKKFLITQIKAEIAQRKFNGREFMWRILVTNDAQIDSALSNFNEAAWMIKRSPDLQKG